MNINTIDFSFILPFLTVAFASACNLAANHVAGEIWVSTGVVESHA